MKKVLYKSEQQYAHQELRMTAGGNIAIDFYNRWSNSFNGTIIVKPTTDFNKETDWNKRYNDFFTYGEALIAMMADGCMNIIRRSER
jgi:hypothetical protein